MSTRKKYTKYVTAGYLSKTKSGMAIKIVIRKDIYIVNLKELIEVLNGKRAFTRLRKPTSKYL
jgi:hypothetical protein